MKLSSRPPSRGGLALAGVVIFYVVSFLTAIGLLALNDWFGVADIFGLPLQSFPLAVAIFFIIPPFLSLSTNWKLAYRVLVGGVIGASIGYLATLCLMVFLGGWFYAISYPIVFCWILGSIASFLVVLSLQDSRAIPQSLGVFIVSLLTLTVMYAQANQPPPTRVIYFHENVTQQEENEFYSEYICIPTGRGTECSLLDELSGVSNYYEAPYSGVHLSFWRDIATEEIDTIMERMLESPYVYKIVDVK